MNQSVLKELSSANALAAEVEAKMVLGDYAGALATTQTAPYAEDRLQLLAIIAKVQQQNGISVEAVVIDQIKELYHQIDKATLAEKAATLACDLVFSVPELAIELIDLHDADKNKDVIDLALATMYLQLNASGDSDNDEKEHFASTLQNRITNPEIKQFSNAASMMMRVLSPDEVMHEMESVSDAYFKVFLLRLWTLRNRKDDEAYKVVNYSLRTAIQMSEYTLNARDIRQMCLPLPFIGDYQNLEHIIKQLDSLRASIKNNGPTVDYIRLQILISETMFKKGPRKEAKDRILDIYFEIDEIKDKQINAECLAFLLAYITACDRERLLETKEGLHTQVEADLKASIEILLSTSAGHYAVLQNVIRAMSQSNIEFAYETAMSLNTEPRRDMALADIVESGIKSRYQKPQLAMLEKALSSIESRHIFDRAIVTLFQYLVDNASESVIDAGELYRLADRLKEITDIEDRCRAYCYAYLLFTEKPDLHTDKVNDIQKSLTESWKAVDATWYKIQIAYKIACTLGKRTPEIAAEYLSRGENLKRETNVLTEEAAWSLAASIRLAISSFAGLMDKNLDSEQDMQRLSDFISQVPSSGEQALLWGDIATRYIIAEKSEKAKKIVNLRIRPALGRISDLDTDCKRMVYVKVAPALYVTNEITTLEQIATLSAEEKDEALYRISQFIIYKDPVFEPYEAGDGHVCRITYDETVKLCEVMKSLSADWRIYSLIRQIVSSVCADKKKTKFTQEQRADVCRRLEELAEAKLPNMRYIKHNGYKIASKLLILQIKDKGAVDWNGMLREIDGIANIADRAFLLMAFIQALPSNKREIAKQQIEIIQTEIPQIPTVYDRAERLSMLAHSVKSIDNKLCRDTIKIAMKETHACDDDSVDKLQKSLVDFAHRIDPELAASLIDKFDRDPARLRQREKLQTEVRLLNQKSKLQKDKSDTLTNTDLPKVAWRSLAALNGQTMPVVDLRVLRKYISCAAELPFSEAYPVLSWAISNLRCKYSQTEQAEKLLRPVFEAVVLACQVSMRMACRDVCVSSERAAIELKQGHGIVIRPSEQERAVNEIKKWISQEAEGYIILCDPYFGPDRVHPNITCIDLVNGYCVSAVGLDNENHSTNQWPAG